LEKYFIYPEFFKTKLVHQQSYVEHIITRE